MGRCSCVRGAQSLVRSLSWLVSVTQCAVDQDTVNISVSPGTSSEARDDVKTPSLRDSTVTPQ